MTNLEQAFGKRLSSSMQDVLRQIFKPELIDADESHLSLQGKSIPVRDHVPRCVPDDDYVGSFSYQWAAYPQAQLDSAQQVQMTTQELYSKASLNPDLVRGKTILDAGVGIGRHAEVFASWGANLVGVDLSRSVEDACRNLKPFDNAVVLQANLADLPFKHGSFDIISSMGVLHHTPDTKEFTRKLVAFLKPGGMLTIWVYPLRFMRRKQWVPIAQNIPLPAFHDWCSWIIDWLRHQPEHPIFRYVPNQMPFRFDHPTFERSVLALFDGYTPTFHGVHSPEEVIGWFEEFGLVDIKVGQVETAVCGRMPL
jgi:SAM-dependent methyltransferase